MPSLRQTNPCMQGSGEPKPELFVETVTLKFLDAKSLKDSIANMSSEYGSMEPDAKGNSLIICDTNENLAKILAQIRKIDRKPDQIMIEVVLVDVKLNDETEIGINWDILLTTEMTTMLLSDRILVFLTVWQSTIRIIQRLQYW